MNNKSLPVLFASLLLATTGCNRPPDLPPTNPGVVPKAIPAPNPSPETSSVPTPPPDTRPPGTSHLDRNITELATYHHIYVRRIAMTSPGLLAQADTSVAPTGTSARAPDGRKVLSGNERNFVLQAASDGQADEQAALYVAAKTRNPAIRGYAAEVGREHAFRNQELRRLAVARGLGWPEEPLGEGKARLDRLRQLKAPEMERVFLQEFGIEMAERSITLFEKQLSGGEDAELKKFAEKLLPKLREYQSTARQIQLGKQVRAMDILPDRVPANKLFM